MAEYLISKKWSDLQKMSSRELSRLPCLEVVDDDGEMIGELGTFLMLPKTDYLRARMDADGELSNSLYVPPEEPMGHTCPVCGKTCKTPLALSGHMRSHKKELVTA